MYPALRIGKAGFFLFLAYERFQLLNSWQMCEETGAASFEQALNQHFC